MPATVPIFQWNFCWTRLGRCRIVPEQRVDVVLRHTSGGAIESRAVDQAAGFRRAIIRRLIGLAREQADDFCNSLVGHVLEIAQLTRCWPCSRPEARAQMYQHPVIVAAQPARDFGEGLQI